MIVGWADLCAGYESSRVESRATGTVYVPAGRSVWWAGLGFVLQSEEGVSFPPRFCLSAFLPLFLPSLWRNRGEWCGGFRDARCLRRPPNVVSVAFRYHRRPQMPAHPVAAQSQLPSAGTKSRHTHNTRAATGGSAWTDGLGTCSAGGAAGSVTSLELARFGRTRVSIRRSSGEGKNSVNPSVWITGRQQAGSRQVRSLRQRSGSLYTPFFFLQLGAGSFGGLGGCASM